MHLPIITSGMYICLAGKRYSSFVYKHLSHQNNYIVQRWAILIIIGMVVTTFTRRLNL